MKSVRKEHLHVNWLLNFFKKITETYRMCYVNKDL